MTSAGDTAVCALSTAPSTRPLLHQVLAELEVEALDLDAVADPLRSLKGSDLLLAQLELNPNPTTLVEIGMALAFRKPVLIVTEDVAAVPLALHDLPMIVSTDLAYADLRLQVEAFALPFIERRRGRRTPAEPRTRTRHQTVGPRVRNEPVSPPAQRPLRQLNRSDFASEIEYEVGSLLTEGGGTVVAHRTSTRTLAVPDLAVTFPELGSAFSPVLVEIAGRRADKREKVARLEEALRSSGVMLGILILLDEQPDRSAALEGKVISLGMHQLRALVSERQLLSTLRSARNQIVHGAQPWLG